MHRFIVIFGFLFAATAALATAQEALVVTSSDPADGEAGVPLTKEVRFNLNKPTPAFGSVFVKRFTWSPTDSTSLTLFGHGPPPENDLRVVFFTLTHTPDTDIAFFAYGVRSDDDATMERPYTLNYTTAAEHGPHVVSGTASFGTRVLPGVSKQRQALHRQIRQTLLAQRALLQTGSPNMAAAGKKPARQPLHAARAAGPDRLSLDRTVILLLDRYVLLRQDIGQVERQWQVRAAAAVQSDDTFAFNHVRDGVYWPVAVNWLDEDGEVVGAYGFYDPDGDLAPDSIVVEAGGMADLHLPLYALEPTTSEMLTPIARAQAGQSATDQQLLTMTAREAVADGQAMTWHYTFYAPSEDRLTTVEIDPVNVIVTVDPTDDAGFPLLVTNYMRQQTPIPQAIIDSDAAFEIAEQNGGAAYRAQFAADVEVPVVMEAGDLELDFRPPPGEVFWKVTYQTPMAGFEELTLFIDIETGAVLQAGPVANEPAGEVPAAFALLGNYPNPFNPETTITFDVAQPGRVSLAVYDMLGRKVRSLVQRHLGHGRHQVVWDGTSDAGTVVTSGLYLYRLEADGFVASRVMTVLK